MRKQREREREAMKSTAGRPTSIIHSRKNSYNSLPINLPLSTVSESSTIQESSGSEPGTQVASPLENAQDLDGGRITSNQEQLVAPLDGESSSKAGESQRSPLSGLILLPLPHDLPPQLLPSVLTETGSGSASSPYSATPESRSTSISAQSVGSTLSTVSPLSSKSSQVYMPSPQQSAHPLWSPPSAFPADNPEFPMRSLPPPKRHGDHGFSSNNFVFPGAEKGVNRKEMPRRSSAAAAVTLGSSGDDAKLGMGRPSYFSRRQSSSPVLIRVNGQDGQDISPLLNNEGSKIFAGSTPSKEVRRPGISPLTSPAGSSLAGSSLSGSISNTSMCSFVTSKYTGDNPKYLSSPLPSFQEEVQLVYEASSLVAPDQDSRTPTGPASPSARTSPLSKTRIPSPLAVVTPMQSTPSGSLTTSSPLLEAPEGSTASSEEFRFPATAPVTRGPSTDVPDGTQEIPSVVVNRAPGTSLNQNIQRVAIPQSAFQFPAPSPHSDDVDPSSQTHDERRLSICSSGTRSSAGEQSDASSRSVSPVASPSFHAAAMELYPGLRKLSLFTAAVSGHPPPPLLSGRKGSAGSTTSRDYHHSRHHQLSTMHDGEENDCYSGTGTEGEGDDLSDEDWAGNMKTTTCPTEPSCCRYGQDPEPPPESSARPTSSPPKRASQLTSNSAFVSSTEPGTASAASFYNLVAYSNTTTYFFFGLGGSSSDATFAPFAPFALGDTYSHTCASTCYPILYALVATAARHPSSLASPECAHLSSVAAIGAVLPEFAACACGACIATARDGR
ncbi:hypothetical protein BGZ92_001319 [Podila epicladia]|nr:hypothetical protein BGZ92_001319 [Podila epicladia]